MTNFISVGELKNYPMPVTDKQWQLVTDAQISVVIGNATQNIRDFLDRDILIDDYVERIAGNGRLQLVLENYPITELTDVSSRDYAENITSYDPTDFIVDSGAGMISWVDRSRHSFYDGYYWIVEYSAGYTSVPGPIKHATALQTVKMLQPLFRGGGNFVEVALIDGLNEEIVDMLEKYKRKRIG